MESGSLSRRGGYDTYMGTRPHTHITVTHLAAFWALATRSRHFEGAQGVGCQATGRCSLHGRWETKACFDAQTRGAGGRSAEAQSLTVPLCTLLVVWSAA